MASRRGAGLRWRIVRPLFELLYRSHTLYWLASTIPFAGQWRVWQRLVLARLAGRDVLEVGCGIGSLLADMAAAGYTCAAIDRSSQMVAAARARLRRHHISPERATVRQADVRALPFADDAFDSVVSTFPTEYITDPRALEEIARVLRPGGRFVVVLGASLLPISLLLWPLVAVQSLVYGRQRHASSTSDTLPAVHDGNSFAKLAAKAGLAARAEQVHGPFWVAQLYVGEKSDS